MFLIIRPDLCLDCSQCDIALACPSDAIERVPLESVDDYRGYYIPGQPAMDDLYGGDAFAPYEEG